MTATLKVNGKAFDGFERGTVFLSMENPANDFDVEYVADGKDLAVRAVFPGDEVDVALDDDVILSGYVETTSDDDDSEMVRLTATGRSRTTDLVACSNIEGPFAWKNTWLGQHPARPMCDPFGIARDCARRRQRAARHLRHRARRERLRLDHAPGPANAGRSSTAWAAISCWPRLARRAPRQR
jgi:prophage tail gpP-like protein